MLSGQKLGTNGIWNTDFFLNSFHSLRLEEDTFFIPSEFSLMSIYYFIFRSQNKYCIKKSAVVLNVGYACKEDEVQVETLDLFQRRVGILENFSWTVKFTFSKTEEEQTSRILGHKKGKNGVLGWGKGFTLGGHLSACICTKEKSQAMSKPCKGQWDGFIRKEVNNVKRVFSPGISFIMAGDKF